MHIRNNPATPPLGTCPRETPSGQSEAVYSSVVQAGNNLQIPSWKKGSRVMNATTGRLQRGWM